MKRLVCAASFVLACGKQASAPPPGAASAVASAHAAVDAASKADANVVADAATAGFDAVTEADEGGLYFHLPEPFWTTDCPEVLRRIAACSTDQAFRAGVTAGLKGAARKEMLRRIDVAAGWKDMADPCDELRAVTFEDEGFLAEDWRDLAAPAVLGDCAALGAGVAKHGGLFGGDVDE